MRSKSTSLHPKTRKVSSFSIEGQAYELECLENIPAIAEMEEIWNTLEKKCQEDFSFFQNYNWCYEYYKQFADDLTDKDCPVPQVFVLKQDNNPIMIWPMMLLQSRIGLKILSSASEPLGQYCNLLFNPSKFNLQVGKATLKALKQSNNADTISFNFYPKDSMLEAILSNQGIKENSNFVSSILDITRFKNWDDYYSTLTKSQRKNRKRNKRKLETEGNIKYEVYEAGSKEYVNLIETALRMKIAWLEETGRSTGILGDKCTLKMFKNLKQTKANQKIGALVHALYLNNKPIAIEMGMIKSRHYYSYLGAIDWGLRHLGPGKIQMEMAFKWAFDNRIEKFDLFHDPSPYKDSWINCKHPVFSTNIPLTYKGRAYVLLWKTHLRPKLKSIYHFASNKTRNRLNKVLSLVKRG